MIRAQLTESQLQLIEVRRVSIIIPSCMLCLSSCRTQIYSYVYSLRRNYQCNVCVHAKSLQSSLTLCDPMNYSLTESSVHGILQARILEWVVMPSSRESSQIRDHLHSYVSCSRFFTTSTTWEALSMQQGCSFAFSLFLNSFVPLRSLMTETGSKASTAARLISQDGLSQESLPGSLSPETPYLSAYRLILK